MTPDAAALMRHNLQICAQQQDDLADRAKSDGDAAHFRRGAETYRRLLTTLPKEKPSSG
jgi:hypothetical protein